MSRRKPPFAVKAFQAPAGYDGDAPSDALARWVDTPRAASSTDSAVISLFDPIGVDPWSGDGWTAKRMAGVLRAIGERPVTLDINSPGGDVFEGLAIFSVLLDHPAEVHVRVKGLAASAASVVAMAGDTLEMGVGSFLMIHNCWGVVVGNHNDLRAAADTFAEFDDAMAGIYADRAGMKRADVQALMDDETYIGADRAVELGFAQSVQTFAPPDPASSLSPETAAKRRLDVLLAKQGVPRSERRALLRAASGAPGAAGPAAPRAGADEAALRSLLDLLKL